MTTLHFRCNACAVRCRADYDVSSVAPDIPTACLFGEPPTHGYGRAHWVDSDYFDNPGGRR